VWNGIADPPAAVLHSQTKVDGFALSQDGERLATVGCLEKEREGSTICALSTIQIWDLQTLKPIHTLEVNGWVYQLALDAHGDWLAFNGEDNVIRLIDGSAGKLVEPALQGLTNAFFDFASLSIRLPPVF
jgi:WD40 repeat protein